MISFSCQQCGRRFDRPDQSAGSLIFCVCGASNTVPYENVLPPLRAQEAAPASSPQRHWGSRFDPPKPQRDAAYCFNHTETPTTATCAGCTETFCADCVFELHGKTFCGPCKNFQIRMGQKSAGLSVAALFAPLVSLLAALPSLLVVAFGAGASSSPDGVLPWIGLAIVPQLVALALGVWGLHTIEADSRKYGGQSLAIMGLASAVVVSVVLASMGVLMATTKV